MKNTGFAIVCFAVALLPALRAQEPTAAGVLQELAQRYANLTSISFHATTVLIDQNKRDGMTMEVAFRQPDKARLLVKGTDVGQAFGLPANEVLIVVDGIYTWMTVPGWKQYTRMAGGFIATDDQSPSKLGPAAAFVSHIVESIGSLVKQYAGTASKMKIAGVDTIHNVECYVVETKSQKPLKRLWIDRARHLLVQEETTTKGGGVLRTSFSDMSVSQPLADSLFVFTPADDAALVETMTPPGRQ